MSDFRNRHEMPFSDFQLFIQNLLEGRVEHFEEKFHDFLRRIVPRSGVKERLSRGGRDPRLCLGKRFHWSVLLWQGLCNQVLSLEEER